MLLVPAILDTFASLKDKTIKLTFYCNELTPQQLMKVAENAQQFGFLAFKNEKFKANELDSIDKLDTEYQSKGKSNSQRLRNVLYLQFQQDNKGYKTFNEYYDSEMNKIIEHFKNKLDQCLRIKLIITILAK